MARVTSKFQVTIPKAIASRYGIVPGDEVEWVAAGDAIRIELVQAPSRLTTIEDRLASFDQATERQKSRESIGRREVAPTDRDRGWVREELYERGSVG